MVPPRLDQLEAATVEARDLADDPGLHARYRARGEGRQGLLRGPEADAGIGRQESHTRGVRPLAGSAPEHRTERSLHRFEWAM